VCALWQFDALHTAALIAHAKKRPNLISQ